MVSEPPRYSAYALDVGKPKPNPCIGDVEPDPGLLASMMLPSGSKFNRCSVLSSAVVKL